MYVPGTHTVPSLLLCDLSLPLVQETSELTWGSSHTVEKQLIAE